MANRTAKDAHSIHGTNPQYLVEKIIRTRIYDSKYWKEHCFALTAEVLVDRAMELRYVGGSFGGNIKVTPFICLILKMLQIQPDRDIVIEFIRQQDFKYVRCLGAMYLRLTFPAVDCYSYLEPLLVDYRKVRIMNPSGEFYLSYVDEFVDELLNSDKVCSIVLPRLTKRMALEELNMLQLKVSALEEDLELEEDDDDEEEEEEQTSSRVNIINKKNGQSDDATYKHSNTKSRLTDRDRNLDLNREDKQKHSTDHNKQAQLQSRSKRRSSSRSPVSKRSKRSRSKDKSRKHKKAAAANSRSRSRSRDEDKEKDKKKKDKDKKKKSRKHKDKDQSQADNSTNAHKDGDGDGYKKDSLSINDANKLRASLGLAPLE